jgi:D-ribose pyranose/furanose isomerase RbsD
MNDKVRRAVTDALNGDVERVDAAVRRALYSICTHMDEHTAESAADHIEIMEELRTQTARLEKKLSTVTRLLTSATVTMLLALATGLLNVILN